MKSLSPLVLVVLLTGCLITPEVTEDTVFDQPEEGAQATHLPLELPPLPEEADRTYTPITFSIQLEPWADVYNRVPFTAHRCAAHGFVAGDLKGGWIYCEATFDVDDILLDCPFVIFVFENEMFIGHVPSPSSSESCGALMEAVPDRILLDDVYTPIDYFVTDEPQEGELLGHPFEATACIGHTFEAGGVPGSWLLCDVTWPSLEVSCPLLFLTVDGVTKAGVPPADGVDPSCYEAGPEVMPVIVEDPSGIFIETEPPLPSCPT